MYSFGIILWEISARAPPFSEFPVAHSQWTSDFEEEIVKGLRPTPPKILSFLSVRRKKNGATQELSDVMQLCWDARSELRPSFDQLLPNLVEIKTAMDNAKRRVKCTKQKDGEEEADQANEVGKEEEEYEYYDDDDTDDEPGHDQAKPTMRLQQLNSLETFVSSLSSGLGNSKMKDSPQMPKYPLKLSDIFSPPEARKAGATTPTDRNPVIPRDLEDDLISPVPTPNPTFPLRLSEILPKAPRLQHSNSQINLAEAVGTSEINLGRLLGTPDRAFQIAAESPELNLVHKSSSNDGALSPRSRKNTSTKRHGNQALSSREKKESKAKDKHRDKETRKEKEREKEKQRASDEAG